MCRYHRECSAVKLPLRDQENELSLRFNFDLGDELCDVGVNMIHIALPHHALYAETKRRALMLDKHRYIPEPCPRIISPACAYRLH